MKPPKSRTPGGVVALLVATLSLAAPAANAQTGPFARMAGSWFGEGRVVLADGQVERIRCRASGDVAGGGDAMRQQLRCAGPSYSFDIRNSVVARQGQLSGNWDERTRNVSGEVTGTVSGGVIRARVDGAQFSASVTLATTRSALRVTLVPHSTNVRQVNIQLRRQ